MKGKLGVLMLALLVVFYFLDKQFGQNGDSKATEDTGIVTVTGIVTNKENGNAIAKALVEAQATSVKTRTDDNGVYSIPAKKGDLLVVSHPKYRRTSVEVEETIQDIQLTPKE